MLCLFSVGTRGAHISKGKFQSGFLKKHITFPGCICFPQFKNIRVELIDSGKWVFWPCIVFWSYCWENGPKWAKFNFFNSYTLGFWTPQMETDIYLYWFSEFANACVSLRLHFTEKNHCWYGSLDLLLCTNQIRSPQSVCKIALAALGDISCDENWHWKVNSVYVSLIRKLCAGGQPRATTHWIRASDIRHCIRSDKNICHWKVNSVHVCLIRKLCPVADDRMQLLSKFQSDILLAKNYLLCEKRT